MVNPSEMRPRGFRRYDLWAKLKANQGLLLLTILTVLVAIVATRSCADDPYRTAVLDATVKCVNRTEVLDRAVLSEEQIADGLKRHDTVDLFATMRELGCLPDSNPTR